MPESLKLTPGQRAVLAALVEHPKITVAKLAEAASVGKSSAAAALCLLEKHGLAVRTVLPLEDGKPRPADIWSATSEAGPVLASLDACETGDLGTEEPHGGRPESDAAPGKAFDGGGGEPSVGTAPEPQPTEPVENAGPAPTTARLAKGALRDAVRQHLLDHPDSTFTPTALSKALSKSSGAISNALDALVARSEAVMVREKPRTFQAAGTAA